MIPLDQHPSGRHFLQIPGPSPVPDRILRAMSLPTIDHRGPEFAVLGKRVIAGMQQVFQTRHPVVIYAGSGTGAWEAALSNLMSPGDAVLMFETGQFASLWHRHRPAPRPEARVPERAGHRPGDRPALVVAPSRAARPDRGAPAPGPLARDPRGLRRAQRDLDRRDLRHRRGAPRDRRRRPSGAAPGRHDLRPRLRRLPARRVGRRRRHGRLAEGPDDAARHLLQRLVAQGDRGEQGGDAAQGLLGLGRDRRDEQGRLLAVDAEHQPALCAVGGARHDPRPGAGRGVRPPPALGRGGARRGPRLGPADPVRRRERAFAGADRRDHARRRRRRCA